MQLSKRTRTDEWIDEGSRTPKSRACTECKRHKVKCERRTVESTCVRCGKFGYKCVSSNYLQEIIGDDTHWKRSATGDMRRLQAAVSDLLRHNKLPELSTYGTQSCMPQPLPSGPSPQTVPTMAMTRENSQEPERDPELVPAPMSTLFEVTKLRNLRCNLTCQPPTRVNMIENDLISRGLLPLGEAEELFSLFNRTMNHFLWGGIALVHQDLSSTRRSSSLLSAAILAVAALHLPDRNEVFEICYAEFITIVSSSLLNRYHTLDEMRGLCIGAFWFSDLSWKLSGHVVRIATEMNLHQSVHQMLHGAPGHFERAQLWYLLYVCDHHFSIAYGRPPVIHETTAIKSYEDYLQCPLAGAGDVRLIAQVALFIILTRAHQTFGMETHQPLGEDDLAQLRAFSVEIEAWRVKWQPKSANSVQVGTYPSKGVVLHYYFAKFQLNALALRSITADSQFSMDRKEAANTAISSAMGTMNVVLYEPDICKAINGVPLFTHTMIAFTAVFLLKVAWKWNFAFSNVDPRQIIDLVQKVADLMSSVEASDRHLTYHIARGLNTMLAQLKAKKVDQARPLDNGSSNPVAGNVDEQDLIGENFATPILDFEYNWSEGPTLFDFPVSSSGMGIYR